MIGGEIGYSQPNTASNSMKTHLLKNRHDTKYVVIYPQSNTSNYSMKTHPLKHRHDRRTEKRYVVVTHSL